MFLGAHVSTRGGVGNAPGNARALGAEAIQVFTSSQRQWKQRSLADEDVAAFRAAMGPRGVRAAMAHDSYLINLACPRDELLQRSREAFVAEVLRCDALGIPALVFHPGSHLGDGLGAGLARIADSLRACLAEVGPRSRTLILLENAAGQGSNIGVKLEELADLLERLRPLERRRVRFGVCLDSCHLFAAGYDLRTRRGYEAAMREVERTIGVDRVRAWHLNDSKGALDCRVDRHENIGQGALGALAFREIVNDARWEGLPMVLETPGGDEWFRKNLALLRSMRRRKGAVVRE